MKVASAPLTHTQTHISRSETTYIILYAFLNATTDKFISISVYIEVVIAIVLT